MARAWVACAFLAVGCGGPADEPPLDDPLPDRGGCPTEAAPSPEPVILASGVAAPSAMDLDDRYVWFAAFAEASVGRVRRNATEAPEVFVEIPSPTAVHVQPDAIFVTTSAGSILSIDPNTRRTVELAVDQPRPQELATTADRLIWVNEGTASLTSDGFVPDGNAGVVSATRTGDAVEPLLSGQDWVGGLAVEEDRVYVAASTATEGTRILELSLGGGLRTVATVAGAVEDVAVHDGFVYWTRPLACAVVRASLDVDGRTEAIATGQNVPSRLFVDERGIVWTNAGRAGNGYEGSHVVASDTDGSNQVTLAAGRNAYALAVDGDAVFFTNNELDGEVAATMR